MQNSYFAWKRRNINNTSDCFLYHVRYILKMSLPDFWWQKYGLISSHHQHNMLWLATKRKGDCRLSRSTSDIPLDYYQPKMAVRVELKWNFAISLVDLVSGTAVQITWKLLLVFCSGHSSMIFWFFHQKCTHSQERHQESECQTQFAREVISVLLVSGCWVMETGSWGDKTAGLMKYSL